LEAANSVSNQTDGREQTKIFVLRRLSVS